MLYDKEKDFGVCRRSVFGSVWDRPPEEGGRKYARMVCFCRFAHIYFPLLDVFLSQMKGML